MNLNFPDRISLAHLPTPIERLDRLGKHLGGPKLIIKRDDQTGLALGGNKTRKLEFLAADALAKGCDHLVTTGAPQSNHCRQTAAAAAQLGLGCSLVLRGAEPPEITGNLLLDKLLGAELIWTEGRSPQELLPEVAERLRSEEHNPYVIPLGGSNVIGATGYVVAMQELMGQLDAQQLRPDVIVFASSSGGTQAGIMVGAAAFGYSGSILGISVDYPEAKLKAKVSALATATYYHLGMDTSPIPNRPEANDAYIGQGYGIVSDLDREAVLLVAHLEGILLDPVYTGRAMGGLIDLIQKGAFSSDQTILFWHTGGTPALFAYADSLL
jgi:D-cysteine desulfhydrase